MERAADDLRSKSSRASTWKARRDGHTSPKVGRHPVNRYMEPMPGRSDSRASAGTLHCPIGRPVALVAAGFNWHHRRIASQFDEFDVVYRENHQHCLIAPSVALISVVPDHPVGRQMDRVLPRSSMCIAAETNRVVQVKYTNQMCILHQDVHFAHLHGWAGKVMLLVWKVWARVEPASCPTDLGLSLSGSNQAREGRLVNALAARGDEGRDTLR